MALDLDPYSFPCDGPLLGVPHGANVLSNLPFLVVGAVGLARLARSGEALGADANRTGLWLSVALLAFGSGAYHLALTPAALAADRVFIAAILAFVVAEVLRAVAGGPPRLGVSLALLAAAEGSVLAWLLGATSWPYGALQVAAGLGVGTVALPGRTAGLSGTARRSLLAFLLLYAVAKAVEVLDGPIAAATGVVGGHPFKHLLAAAGLAALLPWLGRPSAAPEAGRPP